jgi:hypothetical protein
MNFAGSKPAFPSASLISHRNPPSLPQIIVDPGCPTRIGRFIAKAPTGEPAEGAPGDSFAPFETWDFTAVSR